MNNKAVEKYFLDEVAEPSEVNPNFSSLSFQEPADSSKKPDVSILTACLDPNPEFLLKAYNSICKQDLAWEWIIQLDGDDSLLAAIPEVLQKEGRVHIGVNSERLGTASTRNIGLLACKSDFVANTDADDWWHPNKMKTLVQALLDHPTAAFCFGRVRLERDDKLWATPVYNPGLIAPQVIADRWLTTSYHDIALSHTVWRKRSLLASGGWAAQRGQQDVNIALSIAETSNCFYVPEEVGVYRQHEGQATANAHLTEKDERHRRLIAQRIVSMRLQSGKTLVHQNFAMRDGSFRRIFN